MAFFSILIIYLVATLFYLLRLILGRQIFSVIGLRITILGALVQATTLAVQVLWWHRPFFTTYLDYFQSSALLLAAIFITLCFTKKFYASGPLVIVLIDLLCILSLTHPNPFVLAVPMRGQGFLILHLSAIFLSMPVFAIGLVSAVLFLIAAHQIKKKQLVGWVAKLPPLVMLDDIHYKALYAGFLLFTLAILAGAGYAKMTTGHYIVESLKEALGFLLWAFFAMLLNFRVRQGWRGHKGVILALVGFIGMILLFVVGLK